MAAVRAVAPDERAPRKPLTITEAVDAGDRLAEMMATHRRVAKAVQDEGTPARDLASLTRRQLELSKEIEALKRQKDEEESDAGGTSEDEAWDAQAV